MIAFSLIIIASNSKKNISQSCEIQELDLLLHIYTLVEEYNNNNNMIVILRIHFQLLYTLLTFPHFYIYVCNLLSNFYFYLPLEYKLFLIDNYYEIKMILF